MDYGWKYLLRQFALIILVVVLAHIFLGLGLVIGYGFVGDGKNPLAILTPDKWHEIISKFTGK